ncbi:unnamed protein product [Brassica oleracea]
MVYLNFLARTIDLCNNPMTKEPKLQGARRIVTENIWNSTSLSLLRQKILTLLLQETSLKIQNKIWNLRQNCKCRFL